MLCKVDHFHGFSCADAMRSDIYEKLTIAVFESIIDTNSFSISFPKQSKDRIDPIFRIGCVGQIGAFKDINDVEAVRIFVHMQFQ